MKNKILSAFLVIVVLLGTLQLTASAKSAGYTDISGSWYAGDAAKYGYPDIFDSGDSRFQPSKTITRIEFVRLLHRALEININYFAATDISEYFSDMKNADTGASQLYDLVTAGIVEKGGNFCPKEALDREVMVHWIIKALDYKTSGNYAVIMMMPAPFEDDKNISAAYANDIVTARLLQLVNGRDGNMFFPKDGTTRAEAVTVTSRLMALLKQLNNDVVVTPSASLTNNTLEMKLTVTNNSDKTITINQSSGQRFDFKLFDAAGNNIYTWSAGLMFIAAISSYEIKAGESVTYSEKVFPNAAPELKAAATLTAYLIGTSDDFTIDPNGYTTTVVTQ